MPDPSRLIRELVEDRAAAIRAGDVRSIMRDVAGDVLTFDVLTPLANHGAAAVRERVEQWLDSYAGPVDCELRDLVVHAGDDVAFATSFVRFTGEMRSGGAASMWVRSTLGFERRDGRWLIVHEHVSDPMDPEDGRTRLDLAP